MPPPQKKLQKIIGYVKELHVSTDAKTIYMIPNHPNCLSVIKSSTNTSCTKVYKGLKTLQGDISVAMATVIIASKDYKNITTGDKLS